MKNLLKKSLLILCLFILAKISFSQTPPPPPPGPPQPLTIQNNTSELVVAIVLENNYCYSTQYLTSTWYTIEPGTTITVNHMLSKGDVSAYWAGITTFWWPSMPSFPTMLGNVFTPCVSVTTVHGPNQPNASWLANNSIEIN
jgi:hypothetical protein